VRGSAAFLAAQRSRTVIFLFVYVPSMGNPHALGLPQIF